MYIPIRIISPEHRCLPFVLVFLGTDQLPLAIASSVILPILLVILIALLLVVGFDTGMLKRKPASARGDDVASAVIYVEKRRKANPDRKLIFYGVPLLIQYARSHPAYANHRPY